jgi:hypothetical protein
MRNRVQPIWIIGFCALSTFCVGAQMSISTPKIYTGMSDASAAVALDRNLFVVANDEDSSLRVYHREQAGAPLQTLDLTQPLALERKSPETDLEGAARIGESVYWITSHGRNKDGKERPNRYRFLATRFKVNGNRVDLTFIGKPYKNLLQDLIRAPALQPFHLADAARLAPKEAGALNIEGLCATPENQLLIGFRNPVPNQHALLVPLRNPEALLTGKAAQFGDPILLDLGGLGIRDICFGDGKYLIVAGPSGGSGKSKLFKWAGGAAKPELVPLEIKNFNPEAIVVYPDQGLSAIQLLSDDGAQRDNGVRLKDLKDNSAKHFRSVWVELGSDSRNSPSVKPAH